MRAYLQKYTSAAPLAVFRAIFGLMLAISTGRFVALGWVKELYINPRFFFPFYGFEFVRPLGEWTYLLFAICGISALLVAIGWHYRMASVALFLSFTYIEFIDKSTYLNHYYFVSLLCFMLLFLPANTLFSIDSRQNQALRAGQIPAWCLDSIRLIVCMLYFYAGIAKLNSDWLLEALPMKIWLPAKNDTLLIGTLFNHLETAYIFSWIGCIYDLSVGFLLWNGRTRPFAYASVVVFHLLTSLLFPIGMFPYIMIVTALVFFPAEFHQKIIDRAGRLLALPAETIKPIAPYRFPAWLQPIVYAVFALFFVFQITFPFRYLLYSDELFWTEEGYRFSWRVMLMEKAGYTQFTVTDATGRRQVVNNNDFLTHLQEKMMSTQPDMILQYAHMLRDHYAARGFTRPHVYVDSYVALNGRTGKPLIAPDVDLAQQTDSFRHKSWITPFDNEIKGL
ncbi:type I deoxyribonuclease HsdR [Dyadobacter endophyticus]|uniref:Type I deoxyribonuclease HsdR n=1 Tax=Dyadobacter endophyticus TaxID=1749036 RepID=A0ABQ1YD06_9BACT|nr:HTTM domain-containing protein [Dyadobacter endophyticus]GGH20006.1 type I deoxyribonuclease HsdR [Dyadobacter endophyticus]